MSDLTEMAETMDQLVRQQGEFHRWLPKMEVTLVSYHCEDAFQAFQSSYYAEYGEHFCYTISDWLSLDIEFKQELVGKKVMLIKPRGERIGLSGALTFHNKRYLSQRGNDFVVMRDATGLSGIPFTNSQVRG